MTITAETAVDGQRRRVRPEPEHRTVERKRIDGTVIDTVTLDPQIFGIEPNTAVLHQVITAQLAASRAARSRRAPGPRCAAVGPSPSARKGPAGPVRARPAPRTGPVVVWRSAPSPARTDSAHRRR